MQAWQVRPKSAAAPKAKRAQQQASRPVVEWVLKGVGGMSKVASKGPRGHRKASGLAFALASSSLRFPRVSPVLLRAMPRPPNKCACVHKDVDDASVGVDLFFGVGRSWLFWLFLLFSHPCPPAERVTLHLHASSTPSFSFHNTNTEPCHQACQEDQGSCSWPPPPRC